MLSAARNEKLARLSSVGRYYSEKGRLFAAHASRRDNDRAGDIVRTCRDYVIGTSENVRCCCRCCCCRCCCCRRSHTRRVRLPVDQHRDTCKRYRLGLPAPLACAPEPLSTMFTRTASLATMHLSGAREYPPAAEGNYRIFYRARI